ncbi:MAG TPA: hypothetical protein VGR78_04535, partial [Verrucomicrobiae bacterium]|nr:hypothetical protein [Verrucomicrobiae bacterium]
GFEFGNFDSWTLVGNARFNFISSIDLDDFPGSSTPEVHSGLSAALLGQTRSVGTLSRTVATLPGGKYLLSFWAANPLTGTPNEFSVSWDGNTLFDQLNIGKFAWTNFQYVVTASSAETVLQFGFRNDQRAFVLDDVTLKEIDVLRFDAARVVKGSVLLILSGPAGGFYQVQYLDDLGQTGWANLNGPLVLTGGTATVADPVLPSGQRFYRIVPATAQ